MSSTKKNRSEEQVEAIVDALDDAPIDPKDARETVARLGVDVKGLAASLRARVAAADSADRKRKFDEARTAYAREVARLEARAREPKRPREEQLVVLQALLARAPQSVAMHFHKYESASDDELAELVRSLRHLLGEGDADEPKEPDEP